MKSAMTASRQFTLPAHGSIELLLGIVTMLAPALFGFSAAGIILAITLGSVLTGMALTLTGRRGAIVGWHGGFDTLFVVATAGAALALAFAGDGPAAVFLAFLTAIQAVLNSVTRYAVTA
jgi:hypothetical protein